MGNSKDALELILSQLRDITRAIDFCKEQNDPDLWTLLINYALDKPEFITSLLQNIGTHVDPSILIRQIKLGLQIPGLRDSLVCILQDYNLQVRVNFLSFWKIFAVPLSDQMIDWLLDWLLAYTLIDCLIDSKFDWLTDWLIDWLIQSLIAWLIDWLIQSLIDRWIDWLIDWSMDSL